MESDFVDINCDHPFGFFEDFILKGGFREFYTKFFTEKIEIEQIEDCSAYFRPKGKMPPGEEYMLYEDLYRQKPDKIPPQKIYFKDELRDRLLPEKKRSLELIAEKIDSLQTKDEIETYLKKIIIRLTLLVNTIKKNPEIKKYVTVLEFFYDIVCNLHDTYLPFFDDNDFPIIKEAIDYFKINETGFKWKYDPERRNTLVLYTILKGNGVIPDDPQTHDKFDIAFSGNEIKEPLKIRWLLTRGKQKNIKPPLKLIIKNTLMDRIKALEDIEDSSLIKKLKVIFVDSEEREIPHMEQLTQIKNTKIPENEQKLVKEIISAKLSVK